MDASRQHLAIDFTGAAEFAPDNRCSAAYAVETEVVDGVLDVGLRKLPHPSGLPESCDAIGFSRHIEAELSEPFLGSIWHDRYGYTHFLEPPAGLVELTRLPDGWTLLGGRDVEESQTGRWERTYGPDVAADEREKLLLYQAFNGPVNVSGGTEQRAVSVNGANATLYRWPPSGELVLVWNLFGDGLAIVAYEQRFSVEELIALAESARHP